MLLAATDQDMGAEAHYRSSIHLRTRMPSLTPVCDCDRRGIISTLKSLEQTRGSCHSYRVADFGSVRHRLITGSSIFDPPAEIIAQVDGLWSWPVGLRDMGDMSSLSLLG